MLAETLLQPRCGAAASTGPNGDRPAGRLIALSRAFVPEIVKKLIEQAAMAAKERFQRRTGPLLPGKPPVVLLTKVQGLTLAIRGDDRGTYDRRPYATDITEL